MSAAAHYLTIRESVWHYHRRVRLHAPSTTRQPDHARLFLAASKIKAVIAVSEYEATQRTRLSKMLPDQVRKQTSAKKRTVEILIEQKGDAALDQLSRDEALSYADWWEDRIVTGKINAGTANKNISHIGGMIRAVTERLQLRLDNVFAGIRIEQVSRTASRRRDLRSCTVRTV